jgi:hypothetical protein
VSDRTRAIMQDEALAPGKVFTIQLSMLERFVDERPATLLRNETKGARRKLCATKPPAWCVRSSR